MEVKQIDGANWSIRWAKGELSDPVLAMKIMDVLVDGPKPDTAKIFQGTDGGEPAVYVVQRY